MLRHMICDGRDGAETLDFKIFDREGEPELLLNLQEQIDESE
jgi:hypothetical protein